LITNLRSIIGSIIAGMEETKEMPGYLAELNIFAKIGLH
jgi:hypothetical protein